MSKSLIIGFIILASIIAIYSSFVMHESFTFVSPQTEAKSGINP